MGVSLGVQRLKNTAHHGGFLGELHPGIHQLAVPRGAFVFGIGGVFHDDMDLAQVIGRCQYGGGHQGQGHHHRQQQGEDLFLHLLFPFFYILCKRLYSGFAEELGAERLKLRPRMERCGCCAAST